MSAQRLIDTLTKLDDTHEELIALADLKRGALVRNAAEEISRITAKENKLIQSVGELLSTKTEATNDFFRAKGFQLVREVTIVELSRLVTDPGEKDGLLAVRDKLSASTARLKKMNELNQQLIEQSLAYINYSFDLLIGPDDGPVYRHPGIAPKTPGTSTGFFDSKA